MSLNSGTEPSKLRDPEFANERDMLVLQHGVDNYTDNQKLEPFHVNVLVLSYNRPRLIRETLDSIVSQQYDNMTVWVLDDASDFDIEKCVSEYAESNPKLGFVLRQAPCTTPEERATKSRLAEAINEVSAQIGGGEIVHYICDDDILAPHWVSRSARALYEHSAYHIAIGDVCWFNDGEDWKVDSIFGMPGVDPKIPRTWWIAGSFCHLSDCFHDEGLRWFDNKYGHSQDTNFISDVWANHSWYLILNTPSLYHREHRGALSHKLGRKNEAGLYKEGFVPPPATAEMLTGWQED